MTARQRFNLALSDVVELIRAHEALTGGGRGAPAEREGQAISRAAIVILVACMEIFIEETFKESAIIYYETGNGDDLRFLFSGTADRLNHPSIEKVDLLFYNIGLMAAMSEIRWKKTSNTDFKRRYRALLDLRGRVAHGRRPSVRLQVVRHGLAFVKQFADCLQRTLDAHTS